MAPAWSTERPETAHSMKPALPVFAILRTLVCLAVLAAVTPEVGAAATAPPAATEELRREIQRVREEYETRLRALERRLEQLEAPATPPTPAPASPSPDAVPATPAPVPFPAPPEASPSRGSVDATREQQEHLREQFARDTESRDIARELDRQNLIRRRTEQILHDFVDFTGYFRAGYGRSDRGAVQAPFKAPGAQSKYRLGNETENYGELALGKNFYLPGLFAAGPEAESGSTVSEHGDHAATDGPIARLQFRLAFANPYTGGTDLTVPEIWSSIGQVLPSHPEAKFWAGNRFYRRHDIHINDFFFYNMAGKGGGVEDFDIGLGKLALAWIGESSFDATYGDIILPDPANKSGFAKSNWDLRLYDVALPWGKGEFGVTLANAEGGTDQAGNRVDDAIGAAANFVHTAEGLVDERGINKLSLQFGTGPARTFNSGFEVYSSSGQLYILPELEGSWRFRATEHFVVQPYEWLSVGPALVYEYTDFDRQGAFGGSRHWASAGLRPILHFTKNLSLALEGGVDYTDTEGQIDAGPSDSGALWKVTVAPQVSLDRFFFSRPVIRLYFTYGGWNEAFRGYVGGADYADREQGAAFGIQMEAWW
jgi:maltoporin